MNPGENILPAPEMTVDQMIEELKKEQEDLKDKKRKKRNQRKAKLRNGLKRSKSKRGRRHVKRMFRR